MTPLNLLAYQKCMVKGYLSNADMVECGCALVIVSAGRRQSDQSSHRFSAPSGAREPVRAAVFHFFGRSFDDRSLE